MVTTTPLILLIEKSKVFDGQSLQNMLVILKFRICNKNSCDHYMMTKISCYSLVKLSPSSTQLPMYMEAF